MRSLLLRFTCLLSWMLSLPVLAQGTQPFPVSALNSSTDIVEQREILPEELKKFIPEPDQFQYLPKELQNKVIVQLREMIDAEKIWTQQTATLTEPSPSEQQSSSSQLEKNIEQLSTIRLSQHPLQQQFEDLSSHRDNLESQFQNAIQRGNSKLVRGLNAQLSGLESILLLTKLALHKTTSPMVESVLDTTKSSKKTKA